MSRISLDDRTDTCCAIGSDERRAGPILGALQQVSWRKALTGLLGAAIRVHHYRDIRTRMLREALCDADCRCYICEAERKLQ